MGDIGDEASEGGGVEHFARSLRLASVHADEQRDGGHNDEDELQQRLAEGLSHVNGLATMDVELGALADEHCCELSRHDELGRNSKRHGCFFLF